MRPTDASVPAWGRTPIILFICVAIVTTLFLIERRNSNETVSCENASILDEKLQVFYSNKSTDRQRLLGSYLNPKTASENFGPFYNALVAEIVCPWLVRVGNVNDGGKWTCNPWALPENCVIYSLGVGPDITFELEISKVAQERCKIYSFDPDAKKGQRLVNLNSEQFTFTPLRIAAKTNEALRQKTVADIMKQFSHSFIDFFKIDIEGAETGLLPALLGDRNKPIACQIFIEMHDSKSLLIRPLMRHWLRDYGIVAGSLVA
uniref:Methyltransferase domain-containing protein n=1 Tax=Plectus sambesii TaxID=2011161 RepID=A0A914V502_9BILA